MININIEKSAIYFVIVPTIIFITMFWIIPILNVFVISLTAEGSYVIGKPIFIGFDNFINAITQYSTSIKNSIILTLGAATIDLIIGYPLAYLLARKKVYFENIIRASLVFPYFGDLYISYGLWNMFLPGGLFDFFYDLFGISYKQILYTPISVVIGFSIFTLPFMVLYILSALQEVDPSLEYAAITLGASPIKTFFKVVLPLSARGAVAGFLACFGWNLGGYMIPLLLGGVEASNVMTVRIVNLALDMHNYGLAAALAIILISFTIFTTYLTFRITKVLEQ